MNVLSKNRLVRVAVCATVMLWMASVGFAAVAPHGPTFPPDPWCGLVAHGPASQPHPWNGKVAHGPTFPPDPWCGRA
jgi:hypothetical protein